MNQTITSILERRSIRSYKPVQIPEKDINWILEAGLYAATSGNRQPWLFSVVQREDILNKITQGVLEKMRTTNIEQYKIKARSPDFSSFYKAPTVIFLSGKDDSPSAETDCANAAQNMCVAAYSLGIGSCYLTEFKQAFDNIFLLDDVKRSLELPEGYSILFAVSLGYANEILPITPQRNRSVIRYIRKEEKK